MNIKLYKILKDIESYCESTANIANESDKVICILGQITHKLAVAKNIVKNESPFVSCPYFTTDGAGGYCKDQGLDENLGYKRVI